MARAEMISPPGLNRVRAWYVQRGWRAFAFQEEVWAAYRAGQSGLIHAPTGLGKTLAAWLGPVSEALEGPASKGLQVLWLTPLTPGPLDADIVWRLDMKEACGIWCHDGETLGAATGVLPQLMDRCLCHPT